MPQKLSYSYFISRKDVPVIAVDQDGLVTYLNTAFEQSYGWSSVDLIGQVMTAIMPPYMRDAHNFGFSRFLVTENPRILGNPLLLPVHCKNGDIVAAEHIIIGEKYLDKWRFAASIEPKDNNNVKS